MKTIKQSLIRKTIYLTGLCIMAGCVGNILFGENIPIKENNFKLYNQGDNCNTYVGDMNNNGKADTTILYCEDKDNPLKLKTKPTQEQINWYKMQK